jgi:hypothetical protein
MEGGIIILSGPQQRLAARKMVDDAQRGWVITARPPTRKTAQNAKLWPMLDDVAIQVNWHGRKLSNYNWKDIFTAALRKFEVVPGIDGDPVILTGESTSVMSKPRFSELIELIYAFGAEHGVKWSEVNPYDR